MLIKICICGGVLALVGVLSIVIGVCFAMAPDGGGKAASTFLTVGFSSFVLGVLVGVASLCSSSA